MKKVICSEKAPGAIGPYSQAIEANGIGFLPERWRKELKNRHASRWRI